MNLKRILAMVVRHMYIWPRTIERLQGSFGWPLLGLISWGLTMSFFQKNSSLGFSLISFLLGGVVFWEIVEQPQRAVSVDFLDEAWNKNVINIFSSPITIGEFLMSLVILGLIKLSMTMFSLVIGAFILYKFNIFATYNLYIPFLILNLLLFGFSMGFFINGLILQFGNDAQELAWAFAGWISPFSCIYYPLSILPLWAQKIALVLPTTYVFEEMRRVVTTGVANINSLWISFGLNIFYLFLSLIFFRWMFEKARERGRLVKLT